MKIESIEVKNFRLLKEVTLSFDEKTSVIVGRNNSGKTSLTELFRRFISDDSPSFSLDDFSLSVHDNFWEAFIAKSKNEEESLVRSKLPVIEAKISISYEGEDGDLGPLGDFIIDLDSGIKLAIAVIQYRLKDGGIDALLDNIDINSELILPENKRDFFKVIGERIPQVYSIFLVTVDPTDDQNQKSMEATKIRALFQAGFINAQRGLDDTTTKEKDVLGKILGNLFDLANGESASSSEQAITKKLQEIVSDIQSKINGSFNDQLTKILPTLQQFGYPGLNDPGLKTETILDVKRLLENNNTKIRNTSANGIGLPETYNGLGSRNLIYILFHLYEFFKVFLSKETSPGVHIVFIEEPEAHLHPQMQEVFICQLNKIAEQFSNRFSNGKVWPVQFVVTTHSTHIANKAPFDSIRYFLITKELIPQTIIKDLRYGFDGGHVKEDKEFLHKYLTLTRCDLFFADKAMLIEGATERLLMPKMIEKIDAKLADEYKLSSQYLSVVEVGGAFAHHFYKFLDFLELRTLIITDLDSVKETQSKSGKTVFSSCKVSEGTHTSNGGIKKWFQGQDPLLLSTIMGKSAVEKTLNYRRIAYQVSENVSKVCGRSFEAAFILANPSLFAITGSTKEEIENAAWELAQAEEKIDFALRHALFSTGWEVPSYIIEGLVWLSESPSFVENNSIVEKAIPTGGCGNA